MAAAIQDLKKLERINNAVESPIDEIRVLDKITKEVIVILAEAMGLTKGEFVELLPVSERTVERLKKGEHLQISLAEHLFYLLKVTLKGISVFENQKDFAKWLKTPLVSLEGMAPIDILGSILGCNITFDILGRIEYGVYS